MRTPEEKKKYSEEYRKANRQKLRDYAKKWRKNNAGSKSPRKENTEKLIKFRNEFLNRKP